jgi:hypothetical protein
MEGHSRSLLTNLQGNIHTFIIYMHIYIYSSNDNDQISDRNHHNHYIHLYHCYNIITMIIFSYNRTDENDHQFLLLRGWRGDAPSPTHQNYQQDDPSKLPSPTKARQRLVQDMYGSSTVVSGLVYIYIYIHIHIHIHVYVCICI